MKKSLYFALVGLTGLLIACPPVNTPPSVIIDTSINNSSIIQNSLVVSGTAADAQGLSRIDYSINGSTRATALGTNNWSFTASNLTVGNNAITVTAIDTNALEASATVNVTYTVNQPPQFVLVVNKSGVGSGSVSSNPSGINCGSSCTTNFVANTSVTLTATPNSGSSFAGWSGACAGTGTCVVTMSQARDVSAAFSDTTPPTINISSPANNSTVQTATVNVTGAASDNVALSLVQVAVNSNAKANTTGAENWSYSTALNCGANTIVAYAKDTANLETSATVNVTRDCGSFALAPIYPSGQTSYPIAQGADTLYFLTLTPTAPFNISANALPLTAAPAANIGTGTNQMTVTYLPTLSSGNQVAFVIKARSSVPLGATTITLNASAGGVSTSVTINVNVLPCSGGC